MKPDWNDAPEWAKFLAMDGDGSWSWHEHEPEWKSYDGFWWSMGREAVAGQGLKPSGTLESRP